MREQVSEATSCDLPPDTVYAKVMDAGMALHQVVKSQVGRRTRVMAQHVKDGLETVRMQACREIPIPLSTEEGSSSGPTSCASDYKRSIPEKILCRHIPSCEDEDESEMINISEWMKQQEEKRSFLID